MLNHSQLFSGIVLFSLCLSFASAEDVIILKRDGRITKRTGQIVDWQGKRISIVLGSRTRSVNSDDVIELQTKWPSELVEARKSVRANNFPNAIRQFEFALANEKREWVKAIVLAEQIQALDAVENVASAADKFLRLYRLDPDTRFF